MQTPRRSALFFATVLLAGCASINTTAQYLPGAAPKQFAQVAVIAETPDLRLRVAAESSFVRAGNALGVRVVAGVSLFMTGRTYTDSAFVATLRAKGISAVLLVTDATTDAPTVTGSALAIPTAYGTIVTANKRSSQDHFTVSSQLFDVADAQPVWAGSTRIDRNGATDGQLFSGLAKDVLQKLLQSRMIAPADASVTAPQHAYTPP